MNSLENFEPFDDLEEWSDYVELFMDAWPNQPSMPTLFGNWPSLKKEKPRLQNNPLIQSMINLGSRSLRG